MKRLMALALVLALAGLGVPAGSLQAAGRQVTGQQAAPGQIAGAARHENGQPAVNYMVRVRNAATGAVAGATTATTQAGEFSFSNLAPGTYVVEVLDRSGRILATSTSITLGTGAMQIVGVAITLTNSDALAGAVAAGGGNFFKSTAGILLMAGAAGLTVGGVVLATKSPSK